VTSSEFRERLEQRARQANLSLTTDLADALEAYFQLLSKWNSTINLSGLELDDPDSSALDRLLIEPLVAAKHVTAPVSRHIDIGSGGGSPAIPMALALKPGQLLMVESKTRKSVFLREAVRTLKLMRAEVMSVRYELLLSDPAFAGQYDLLTVRAVRVSSRILEDLQRLTNQRGVLMLFRSDTAERPVTLPATLRRKGDYRLLDSLQSRVLILERS
jgi:16S rRNA (guanine527-N7)-methyltransferase